MAKQQQQGPPGAGLNDQQQAALVQLGKMMGPQTDEFDEGVQKLHDQRHQAEHEATDYNKEFAEIPHEAGYKKMKAAQTGGPPLEPSEMEQAAAKQQGAIEQQTATAGQVQASKAQAAQAPMAPPPAAPGGPVGVTEPYPAEREETPPGIPEAPGGGK